MAPHPSLSRNLWQSEDANAVQESTPRLVHSLGERRSVLSLAVSDSYIFCGSQGQDIPVWDRRSLRLKDSLRGHTGFVLALIYAEDEKWLFSASGDSTVRVWCTTTLSPLYVISPYLETGAGDLFSLAWVPSLRTLYVGCQNTSIQWFDFNTDLQPPSPTGLPGTGTSTPRQRDPHKFFDSYPQYERKPADIYANNGPGAQPRSRDISPPASECGGKSPRAFLNIPAENVVEFAHFGYIYCMALLQEEGRTSRVRLATGGGDEFIKIWDCSDKTPTELHAFECTNNGAIYSLVVKDDSTVFAGCQDGSVKVLDLDTKTIVRSIIVQEGVDVLSLSMVGGDLYACSANGKVQRFSASFDCTASWTAHDGIVLSSIITEDAVRPTLITGGNDHHIKMWELSSSLPSAPSPAGFDTPDTLTYALSKFISIPSVSSISSHREDCRQAAIWLKKCLAQLGATSQLLPTEDGKNPLVLGTFTGVAAKDKEHKPRVLFYGHYDVIPAPSDGWDTEPFHMTGRSGYLYGRGCTDNKGPILAVACAAADLLAARKLGVDVVFLVEGEEECGSAGFGEAVKKHKDLIGHIDAILVSNSTWFGEDTPCITYGLRGVVHCSLEISNDRPDLHSGIEGGAVVEPLVDMVHLLATLTDRQQQVLVPSFYDRVRKQDDAERERFAQIANGNSSTSTLSSRWREPALTVHSIDISGPRNATVIPGTIKSQVSIRIVPDQDLDTVAKSLCQHLETSFEALKSPNKLKLAVKHTADWWLGELDGFWFDALENAVAEEWGVRPLRIREGGSIPSIPFLEKQFGCHALHLPMGQSSDQAHLPNERISLDNLRKGKVILYLLASRVSRQFGSHFGVHQFNSMSSRLAALRWFLVNRLVSAQRSASGRKKADAPISPTADLFP
uniref:Beta-Ala-His dipeptidase n=1 Tax=Mycena chlorophos TaxID=658473 RepID=A0ABQ0LHH4_MYCCL|nr:beta-Ala-His dipeptidase [Mycena chlorophos]